MNHQNVCPALQGHPWERSLCFTGHRPEKLPPGNALTALTEALHYYIEYALRLGFTHFLTGAADGIAYLAAECLFSLRSSYPEIVVIGVQPCQDYEDFFRVRGYSLPHLHQMQKQADKWLTLPGSWRHRSVFFRRNCLMVDNASGIIAVCSEGRSGSMQTLQYARQRGLAICRLYPVGPPGPYPTPAEWPVERRGF